MNLHCSPLWLWPMAVVVLVLMVTLTLWAYVGINGATGRQLTGVLSLRLTAFVIALLAVIQPYNAFPQPDVPPTKRTLVVILVDRSRSMGDVKDHGKDQSRWSALLQHLEEAAPEIKKLVEDEQIDIVFRAFGAEVVEFDPAQPLPPTDPRTDIGAALHQIYEEFSGRKLRAVLLLTDGADTRGVHDTLKEARRFRGISCPVHAFAYGNPNTPNNVKAIAVVSAVAEPSPVMAKGDLTVVVTLDAPGFVGKKVRVILLLDGKEVKSQDVELDKARGNEIRLNCTAPAQAGEVDVTVRVEDPKRPGEPPPGQVSTARNELTTFLTVAKEGISVLLVDKQRAWEPQAICDALQDRRIHLHTVWLRGDRPIDANVGDLFQFDKQQYDVIILGDVTADQLTAVNPNALTKIEDLVGNKGAGFIMLGGYSSFYAGVWKGTPIEKLLPVRLDMQPQEEKPVQMTPTEVGLRRFGFVLKQGNRKEETEEKWDKLTRLDGHTRLGALKPGAEVLATTDDGKTPLLVMMNYGGGKGANQGNAGRVLAFAADTTHRWIQDPESMEMHARFWRRTVLWLAKQEDPDGTIWVRPEQRRLPVRGKMKFEVGMRKGDYDVKDGLYKVKLFGPGLDKAGVPLTTLAAGGVIDPEYTKKPGLFWLEATGSGTDGEGNKVDVKEAKQVKFSVFDDDLETAQQAADHVFLKKLAREENGEFREGKDLATFLSGIRSRKSEESKKEERRWPDWQTTGTSPFLMLFYLAFVAVLTGEWLLRRRWGMV